LDYYQRTTFEVVAKDIGAQSAVAGGGRYDGLIRDLGGPNLPGTGFACGMERLALLSKAPKKAKTDFYLAVSEPEACNQAILIGQDLREQGLHGRVSFEARSFKSQLRLANKAGVSFCLLLGADELARQEVLVKDMTSGNQTAVACTNLARYLKDNIHSG
jgi:histidyl-tRNA synthetase